MDSVFQQFFEDIAELRLGAGSVWRRELYFNGSKMQANAAMESLISRRFRIRRMSKPKIAVTPLDKDRYFTKLKLSAILQTRRILEVNARKYHYRRWAKAHRFAPIFRETQVSRK